MTLDELKQQLAEQLQTAETAEDAARANLRRAELRSAFVRGQLAALNQINITPVYTEGQDPPAEPPAEPPQAPPGKFLEG